MANDHLKTPYGQRANELATKRAMDAIQGTGRALPVSVVSGNGTFVLVKFELQSEFTLPQVRVPVLTSEYFRMPIQPGCRGVVISADYYLGGVSGLGGGVANTTTQSNLGALVFAPIGTTEFPSVPDGVAVVYGPQGVVIRNASGSASMTISAAGRIDFVTTGGVWMNGIRVDQTHRHGGVQIGGGVSGVPV